MEPYILSKSKEYNKQLKQFLSGGVHYNFRTVGEEVPRHFKSGKGSYLWDLDNNKYLDFYCKFGAMILGHNHPEYGEALEKQIYRLLAVNHTDLDLEVSELVVRSVPGIEKVRFGLSGTEIIQNALRLARAYTGKDKFLRFEGHYHGNMDNIMGGKMASVDNPYPVEFPGDPRATAGRVRNVLKEQSYILPWNDLALLNNLLQEKQHEIAAIIMEPICINGGGIMPLPGYLEEVRKLCDKYNIVLIFDEVITGFRVDLGGAQKILGVIPDLTVLGKAVGGGMPVSILGGKKEIMDLYSSRKVVHAGTFNGYPLGLAAIKATIEILSRDNGVIYEKMKKYAETISKIMIETAAEVGLPLVVQGPGPVVLYHCCDKKITGSELPNADTQVKSSIINRCMADHGILISLISRMYFNVMFNDEDLEFFAERIGPSFKAAAQIIHKVYKSSNEKGGLK